MSQVANHQRTPESLRTLIAALLIALPAVGLLLAGSTRPWQLAVLHLLLALTLGLTARRQASSLSHAGRAERVFFAMLPLLLVNALGLLPLPAAALRVVAPGVAAARPDFALWTLSEDPAATLSELGVWTLLAGYALAVGVWGSRGRKAARAQGALFSGVAALMVFALFHAVTGAHSILGLIPVQDLSGPFFAPFVNTNFMGTVLLVAFPLAVSEFLHALREEPIASIPFGLLACSLLIFMLGLGSFSTLLALAVLGVPMVFGLRGVPKGTRTLSLLLGVPALLLAFGVMWRTQPDWVQVSVRPRVTQWLDAPAVLRDHWLAGTGGGAYGAAYPPYRSVVEYLSFDHAHMDALEWLMEHGLLGLVALAAALLLLPRGEAGERRRYWTLGLIAALASSLWNFPLQIPGIALLLAGVAAVRLTCFDNALPTSERRVRGLLYALAIAQLGFAGWQGLREVERREVAVAEAPGSSPTDRRAAGANLGWIAPWNPAGSLALAWVDETHGDVASAIDRALTIETSHPDDGRALRRAALILLRHDRGDDALRLLERAAVRDPNDFRTWVALQHLHEQRLEGGEAIQALTEALHHWPAALGEDGRPLRQGWSQVPIADYWIDELADAPGYWSHELARILLQEHDAPAALRALRQAADLEPVLFADSAQWVYALLEAGRADEAEHRARALVRAYPDDDWYWRALGAVLERQGRYNEAAAVYLDGFRSGYTSTGLALLAIRASAKAGGPESGLAVVSMVRLHLRSDPLIALEAARLHLASGEPVTCLRQLEGIETSDIALRKRINDLRLRCTP